LERIRQSKANQQPVDDEALNSGEFRMVDASVTGSDKDDLQKARAVVRGKNAERTTLQKFSDTLPRGPLEQSPIPDVSLLDIRLTTLAQFLKTQHFDSYIAHILSRIQKNSRLTNHFVLDDLGLDAVISRIQPVKWSELITMCYTRVRFEEISEEHHKTAWQFLCRIIYCITLLLQETKNIADPKEYANFESGFRFLKESLQLP
jgi:hypothetical protein